MSKLIIKSLKIQNDSNILVDLLNNEQKNIIIDSTLAIIGQSGSGKSLILKAILKVLPNNLTSNFNYDSNFKLDLSTIGFIPQNPFTSLSPLTKINKQFFCQNNLKDEMLKLVGLEKNILEKFPSQLSGGQLQRIVIAITLCKKPKLLLLDEPTTALDTKNKQIILNLLSKLHKQLNILMIYVTHDISSIEKLCKEIIILKNGHIIEYDKLENIIHNPQQSYTKKLISSGFTKRQFRI
jgi:peptide/nickel transport system ATP-binding protein